MGTTSGPPSQRPPGPQHPTPGPPSAHLAQQLRQALSHWLEGGLGVGALGAAQVRGKHGPGPCLDQILDGGQAGADAGVIGDGQGCLVLQRVPAGAVGPGAGRGGVEARAGWGGSVHIVGVSPQQPHSYADGNVECAAATELHAARQQVAPPASAHTPLPAPAHLWHIEVRAHKHHLALELLRLKIREVLLATHGSLLAVCSRGHSSTAKGGAQVSTARCVPRSHLARPPNPTPARHSQAALPWEGRGAGRRSRGGANPREVFGWVAPDVGSL